MEVLTTAVVVALLFLLDPTSAVSADDQVKVVPKSLQHVQNAKSTTLLPSLPRKLIQLNQLPTAVKGSADKDFTPHQKFIEPSSGTKQHDEKQENVMQAARKGTWREWVDDDEEGRNKSEYFSMDYGWVKRRRPIHNKHVPFVP